MTPTAPRGILHRYLPILTWAPEYSRHTLTNDLIVACIVTIMLIPQSLAYALLAGLPAQVGLCASMAPLVLYAIFGTSRQLVVVVSSVQAVMPFSIVAALAPAGTAEFIVLTTALAMAVGIVSTLAGLLHLGRIAQSACTTCRRRATACRARSALSGSTSRSSTSPTTARRGGGKRPPTPPSSARWSSTSNGDATCTARRPNGVRPHGEPAAGLLLDTAARPPRTATGPGKGTS